MHEDLAHLIAKGIASPDCIIELTNGRGEHDEEQPGIVYEDKPEHKRDTAESH